MGTPRKSAKKRHFPKAPEELEDEALLEWDRICAELEEAGRLEKTDRAILVVYVELWSVHRRAVRKVNLDGFIMENNNGTEGRSAAYTVMRETAAQLRRILNDLKLTPASRGGNGLSANAGELDF